MKINKKISKLVAILISSICLYYIVNRLMSDTTWMLVLHTIRFDWTRVWYVLLVLVFIVVNWLIESVKWQVLCEQLQQLTLRKSFESLMLGLAMGMITPNRVGEIGGRALVFKPQNRPTAAVLAGLSGFFQLTITVLGGVIAVCVVACVLKGIVIGKLLVISFFVLIFTFLLLFFCLKKINSIRKPLERIAAFFSLSLNISEIELSERLMLRMLFLSAVRYGIFFIQFCLLLQFLSVSVSLGMACAALAIAYLVSAAIPSWAITDLGIKGATVMFVLQSLTSSAGLVVLAVLLLWIFNVALPSMLGSVLLLRRKSERE